MMCNGRNCITHVFLSNWSHPDVLAGADSHGKWKKWLLTASNPDEEKEKKPRQTFPGSAAPTWKGFNVTSLPAPALSNVEQPASALFSLQPSTLLVCWSSRLTRCDLTPLDFHTGGKLPSCLTTSMFIDPVLPLPRGPGSHTRFYFPLS